MSAHSESEFRDLKVGQQFTAYGCVYEKKDERRALVVRDVADNEPRSEVIHRFYPENLVKPIEVSR